MLSERQALELLRAGAVSLDPLEFELLRIEDASGGTRVDWLLGLSFDGRTRIFAVEYSRLSTPRSINQAIAQLQRWKTTEGGELASLPLLMAPYLNDETLELLIREGISGIDFSGNGVIYVPDDWFILRTGAKNRYPTSSSIKQVYQGKSSLVGRVLLEEREFGSVGEVRDAIENRGVKIAFSTVSKVLARYEEDLLVAKKPTVRLLQPGRLLENLRSGFRQPVAKDRIVGKAAIGPGSLARLIEWSRQTRIRVAADGRARYVLMASSRPMTRLYVSQLGDVAERIELDASSLFPNLEVISTDDPSVFFDLRQAEGVDWTSPLQVFLELANGDKRERETADQLLTTILEERELA
jgi:hypothetical protein